MKILGYFWDGKKRLSGTLNVSEIELSFEFDDFQTSNLVLQIPLNEIEQVEIFFIFDFAKNGLKIKTVTGKENCFIIENPYHLKEKIYSFLSKK